MNARENCLTGKVLGSPAVLLLIVLAGVIGYHTNANWSAAPMPPSVVASVDIEAAFKNVDERTYEDARINDLREALDAEREKLLGEIRQLEVDLEILQPGSSEHREASERAAELSFKLQGYIDFANAKLDNERAQGLRSIYQHMRDASELLCEELSIDVIVIDDTIPKLPRTASEQEMTRQISARRLLHTRETIDITGKLIERMNERYVKRGQKVGTGQ